MNEPQPIIPRRRLCPLQDRVRVKRLEPEHKTASKIVIPGTATEKTHQGEVSAVGNGKILKNGSIRPLQVKAVDRILFDKYDGQNVKVQGEELLVLREEEIMAVIQG